MVIDEYISINSKEDVDSQQEKPKRKKTKDVLEVEDHELIRKRDILASVALLDGLKSYIGEDISAAQIRKMEKKTRILFSIISRKSRTRSYK